MNQTIIMNKCSTLSLNGSCSNKENTISEELIREKAYYLWESAGRPEGDGSQFWLEAEKLIQEEA